MKVIIKNIIVIFSVAICALNLFACRSCDKYVPWGFPNSIWTSNEPEIKVTVIGYNQPTGYIVIDGKKVDIELHWGEGYSFIILYADYEVISDEVTLLNGIVTKCKEESTTLKIKKDNVFNDKYKEIVLYRKAIDQDS